MKCCGCCWGRICRRRLRSVGRRWRGSAWAVRRKFVIDVRLGAHLPAASPEHRETVAGECLGCQTQFVIDVRLPLPATCPDCGADVLASADIKGEAQPRLPFDPLRIRRTER